MTRKLLMSGIRMFAAAVAVAVCASSASAQDVALKTNLISDALANPNVGVEFKLAPKWTMDVTGELNLWTFSDNKRWKHWMVQPEARYWFCDRFSGHFVGAHLLGGQYNIGGIDVPVNFLGTDFRKLKDYRYQGWFGGAGVVYGYDWILGRHWNLEAVIGLGWTYTRYDQFKCAGCGKKLKTDKPHNFYGPTKAAINIVYTF